MHGDRIDFFLKFTGEPVVCPMCRVVAGETFENAVRLTHDCGADLHIQPTVSEEARRASYLRMRSHESPEQRWRTLWRELLWSFAGPPSDEQRNRALEALLALEPTRPELISLRERLQRNASEPVEGGRASELMTENMARRLEVIDAALQQVAE